MEYDVKICSPRRYFEIDEFYVHDDGERIRVLYCVDFKESNDEYHFQVLHEFESTKETE